MRVTHAINNIYKLIKFFELIMYISWDTCNYIISATILDFWLPISSGSVTDSTIEKFAEPECPCMIIMSSHSR